MAPTQDELREHLVAAIEAAPELAKEDRQLLADVFLDWLNADYDLVPRGTGKRLQAANPAGRAPQGARWVPSALVLAFLVFVVPAAFRHHVPIFLLALAVLFFAVRSSGLGMKRRRPVRQ